MAVLGLWQDFSQYIWIITFIQEIVYPDRKKAEKGICQTKAKSSAVKYYKELGETTFSYISGSFYHL